MAASSLQAATAALDEPLNDVTPTERPPRPPEPHKPRELKDPVKNAERMAEYKRLHDAWEVEHAAWHARGQGALG